MFHKVAISIGVIGIGMLAIIPVQAEAQTSVCPTQAVCGTIMSRDADGSLTPLSSDGVDQANLILSRADEYGQMQWVLDTSFCGAIIQPCVEADGTFVFDHTGYRAPLQDGLYEVLAQASRHTVARALFIVAGGITQPQEIQVPLAPVYLRITAAPLSVGPEGGWFEVQFSITNLGTTARRMAMDVTLDGQTITMSSDSYRTSARNIQLPRTGETSFYKDTLFLDRGLPSGYFYRFEYKLGIPGQSYTRDYFDILKQAPIITIPTP